MTPEEASKVTGLTARYIPREQAPAYQIASLLIEHGDNFRCQLGTTEIHDFDVTITVGPGERQRVKGSAGFFRLQHFGRTFDEAVERWRAAQNK